MEAAINKCITSNGSKKWGWKKGKMAYLSAYMAYQSRGETINIATEKNDIPVVAVLGVRVGSHVTSIGAVEAADVALPEDLNAASDASVVRCLDGAAEARMIEEIDTAKERTRALVVGLQGTDSDRGARESLEELRLLARTSGRIAGLH